MAMNMNILKLTERKRGREEERRQKLKRKRREEEKTTLIEFPIRLFDSILFYGH